MDRTLDFESQSALMKAAAKVHAQKLQARTVDGICGHNQDKIEIKFG